MDHHSQEPAKRKILIVYAHPNHDKSRLNKGLIDKIQTMPFVTISNLYDKYPDAILDIAKEQELVQEHSLIILQFPLYWFNTTPLMKKWIDEVFAWNFAYGPDGYKMHGKEFMLTITIGGTKERYFKNSDTTLPQLLKPFEHSIRYCSGVYQFPFIVAEDDAATQEDLLKFATQYATLLNNYLKHGSHAFKIPYPSY